MHYQRGKDRDQVFMTSLGQLVELDSWARIVDLFVDAMPIEELFFLGKGKVGPESLLVSLCYNPDSKPDCIGEKVYIPNT